MARWTVPLPVRAVLAAALALVAVQALHLLGAGSGAWADAFVDRWLFGGLPLVAAALIATRAALVRDLRLAWALGAAGVAAWALGNLAWLTVFHMRAGSGA